MAGRPALWRCPKCRRGFANRNQSHACGRYTLTHHFRGKSPEIRALFDGAWRVRAIGRSASFLKDPHRFQVLMSFAQ